MRALTISAIVIGAIAIILSLWAITGGFSGGGTSVGGVGALQDGAVSSEIPTANKKATSVVSPAFLDGTEMTATLTGKDDALFKIQTTLNSNGKLVYKILSVTGNLNAATELKTLEDLALKMSASSAADAEFKKAVSQYAEKYIDIATAMNVATRLATEVNGNAMAAGKTISSSAQDLLNDKNAILIEDHLEDISNLSAVQDIVGTSIVNEILKPKVVQ